METQTFHARAHWEQVYETKTPQTVSWTQEDPQPSLDWILGTFSPDGPLECSGLSIRQYDADALIALFEPDYQLVKAGRFTHVTPSGGEQAFIFVHLGRA